MKNEYRQWIASAITLASVVSLIIIAILLHNAKLLKNISAQLNISNKYHTRMINFVSMFPKKICNINGVRFYVPNYPRDLIQSRLVDRGEFFESDQLKCVEEYIKKGDVILDIGANIGSYSLYWANTGKAKKIYAFEPLPEVFDILKKNVEINKFREKITLFNIGLSNKKTNGKISVFTDNNIGGANICQAPEGDLKLERLDDIKLNERHIDFVKIDVEGHELFVLQGAHDTLMKYKPVIHIEIWRGNLAEVHNYLTKIGYVLEKVAGNDNYVYVFKKN